LDAKAIVDRYAGEKQCVSLRLIVTRSFVTGSSLLAARRARHSASPGAPHEGSPPVWASWPSAPTSALAPLGRHGAILSSRHRGNLACPSFTSGHSSAASCEKW